MLRNYKESLSRLHRDIGEVERMLKIIRNGW